MNKTRLFSFLCAFTIASGILSAQGPLVTYHFDEFGYGIGSGPGGTQLLPGTLASDPGPGGLASALSYSGLGSPPSLVAGDLFLFDADNTLSDLIRFNPAGTGGNPAYLPTLVFYSSPGGFPPTPADTGFPLSNYTNTVSLTETVLSDGAIGVVYTPTAGQPGFVSGFTVVYNLTSDAPEPGSMSFCLIGALALLGVRRSLKARMSSH
jgi:hypothetical protein